MEKPIWVRRINYLADAVGGARHMVNLDPDDLIELAQRSTGLSNFGDEEWLPGYRVYFSAMARGDSLHLLGRLRLRSNALRVLRNKLFATEAMRTRPAIAAETIRAPWFIVGNPRSGTSILFELLAQDARFRAPLTWEAALPVSTAAAADTQAEWAQGMSDLMMDMEPDMRSIHEYRWDLPAECHQLMEISFVTLQCISQVSADNRYSWHRKVLQMLQHRREPKCWLLKCNFHLEHLEKLLGFYPDAKIINTHRDPAKSIPSLLSLQRRFQATLGDVIATDADMLIRRFERNLARVIAQRQRGVVSADQIIDVHFSDLVRDPLGTIQTIYNHFDVELTDGVIDAMLRYMAARPRDKYGLHRYSEGDDRTDVIRRRLRFYTDHYAIAIES